MMTKKKIEDKTKTWACKTYYTTPEEIAQREKERLEWFRNRLRRLKKMQKLQQQLCELRIEDTKALLNGVEDSMPPKKK